MTGSKAIGAHGERTVAALLPGAINLNEAGDVRKPYDIDWDGIKIDVKATTLVGEVCSFTISPSKVHTGTLLVFVALGATQNHFWVDAYSNKPKRIHRLEHSIPGYKVAEAVRWVAQQKLPVVTAQKGKTTLQVDKKLLRHFDKLRLKSLLSRDRFINVLLDRYELENQL